MNTKLSPENTITCSKGHGKIANNNSSQTWQKSLDMAEITSGCNVQSYQTKCYMNLSWQKKAWHSNNKAKNKNPLLN